MKSAAAALVRPSADGHRWEHVLSVMLGWECPRARWTVTTSHPEAMSADT